MKLTIYQQKLHTKAIELSQNHRKLEYELVFILQQIDQDQFFKKLGHRSLFAYAVNALKLHESTAYGLITVARKALQVQALGKTLHAQSLSVGKAKRICSAITENNAASLIAFAETHSTREIDAEVARLFPRAKAPDKETPLSADLSKIEFSISKEVSCKLERARSLLASRKGRQPSLEECLDEMLSDFLERHDPVQQAQRAEKKRKQRSRQSVDVKPAQTDVVAHRERPDQQKPDQREPLHGFTRKPLSAAEKHEVFARDGGRCTHIDPTGDRCMQDRWLHVHHIIPVGEGGSNSPNNLTTLCSFHHDLVHQLSFQFAPLGFGFANETRDCP